MNYPNLCEIQLILLITLQVNSPHSCKIPQIVVTLAPKPPIGT